MAPTEGRVAKPEQWRDCRHSTPYKLPADWQTDWLIWWMQAWLTSRYFP